MTARLVTWNCCWSFTLFLLQIDSKHERIEKNGVAADAARNGHKRYKGTRAENKIAALEFPQFVNFARNIPVVAMAHRACRGRLPFVSDSLQYLLVLLVG